MGTEALQVPHPRELSPSLPFRELVQWYVCGPDPTARQGWKLYVPMTIMNVRELLARLIPLLERSRLPFKYIKNIQALRKLNAARYSYAQVGKSLVIYMPRMDSRFIRELKRLLTRYRDQCPSVPCARPFGGGLPLYYRYGAFTGDRIVVRGLSRRDNRWRADLAVPPGVRDVMRRHTTAKDPSCRESSFLLRYPAFAAMAQGGKGGLFRALNLASETYQEVVLKVGYHRGQLQLDGSDGCSFLRRELAFYRLLAERGLGALAPRLIDSLDRPGQVMAVMERIDGDNLLVLKLTRRLSVSHLERSWEIMDRIHRRGLVLGDAKLSNFLASRAGDLRAIDFEGAGVIGQPAEGGRTFRIADIDTDDVRVQDQLHFLASVLHPYRRRGPEDRAMRLKPYLDRAPRSRVAAWACEKLRGVLGSTQRPPTTRSSSMVPVREPWAVAMS